jgi:hypothetical protein
MLRRRATESVCRISAAADLTDTQKDRLDAGPARDQDQNENEWNDQFRLHTETIGEIAQSLSASGNLA